MCNPIVNLLDLNFSGVNDEYNWFNNSLNPLQTISGQLVFSPSSATSNFRRGLGIIAPENDRIRIRSNMFLFKPQTSTQPNIRVVFGVYIGASLIEEFSIEKTGLATGELFEYNFDRVYKYDQLSGNVSLKITFPEGFSNQIKMDYLKVDNFKYCPENIRTYFVFSNYISEVFNATVSGVKLLEYKIDSIETLTPSFFSETANPGGNFATRLFAKAKIDGSERISQSQSPNTFNPFSKDLGLLFDTVNSFHGGKPIGTASGSNYGPGIMNLGFEKPTIQNGQLTSKDGCFFIDIDYTKNLKVVFDVLFKTNGSGSVYQNPTSFKRFYIIWNAQTCEKEFYYTDMILSPNQQVSAIDDGFLYGITEGVSSQTVVPCNQAFSFSGNAGEFTFILDLGNEIGMAGLNYNAYGVPDKFTIDWNGQVYTTGYVGQSYSDQQLINLGVPPSDIHTSLAGTGLGVLNFYKSAQFPTTATVTVTAPLGGTAWQVAGICPEPPTGDFIGIYWNDTQTVENRTGTETNIFVGYFPPNYNVTEMTWQINANGGGWIDFSKQINLPSFFPLAVGTNLIRMKAKDASNVLVYSNELNYTRNSVPVPTCKIFTITPPTQSGEEIIVDYIDCNGDGQTVTYYWQSNSHQICAREITSWSGMGSVTPTNIDC